MAAVVVAAMAVAESSSVATSLDGAVITAIDAVQEDVVIMN